MMRNHLLCCLNRTVKYIANSTFCDRASRTQKSLGSSEILKSAPTAGKKKNKKSGYCCMKLLPFTSIQMIQYTSIQMPTIYLHLANTTMYALGIFCPESMRENTCP